MGIDPQLLGQGEVEVLHLRNHVKVLIAPALFLLLIAVLTGVLLAVIPATWPGWVGWVVGLLAVVAVVVLVVVPFLQWWFTTYTFTNRRIITRQGILARSGHDLPLSRINDVSYARSVIDRMFGCGRLELTTAADDPVVLKDIPDIERVHVLMTELLFAGTDPIKPPQSRDE